MVHVSHYPTIKIVLRGMSIPNLFILNVFRPGICHFFNIQFVFVQTKMHRVVIHVEVGECRQRGNSNSL